jgi:TM2 domain-containing membrane protein YozV
MAPVSDLKNNAFDWVLGCLLVYCSLFGIGKIIFGQPVFGILLLALAALCGYLIFWDLSQRGWESLSGVAPKTVDLEAVATENRN